jgi:hypothetical protein
MRARALAAAGVMLVGCRFEAPGYDGTAYRCREPPEECPVGYVCLEGFCLRQAQEEDGGAEDPADGGVSPTFDAAIDATPAELLTIENAEDTYVEDGQPLVNFGADEFTRADETPQDTALVRFDVSGIPAGATVTAATVELWTKADDPLDAGRMRAYAVTSAWEEGVVTFATAPTREATHFDEFNPKMGGKRYAVNLPVGLVEGWRADAATNHGFALLPNASSGQGASFYTSENPDAARRPRLLVWYLP